MNKSRAKELIGSIRRELAELEKEFDSGNSGPSEGFLRAAGAPLEGKQSRLREIGKGTGPSNAVFGIRGLAEPARTLKVEEGDNFGLPGGASPVIKPLGETEPPPFTMPTDDGPILGQSSVVVGIL